MKDLVGQRFGRLVVQEFVGRDSQKKLTWSCLCDCGTIKIVRGSSLKDGNTKSCGCLRKELITIHDQANKGAKTKEYSAWISMIQRCNNPKNPDYVHYGGRGIKVCDRWLKFENFYEDMGKRPECMTLERKDNDGGYEPGNCRWATREEQNNNTRRNRYKEHEGERRTITQWARHIGISKQALSYRLSRNDGEIGRSLIR